MRIVLILKLTFNFPLSMPLCVLKTQLVPISLWDFDKRERGRYPIACQKFGIIYMANKKHASSLYRFCCIQESSWLLWSIFALSRTNALFLSHLLGYVDHHHYTLCYLQLLIFLRVENYPHLQKCTRYPICRLHCPKCCLLASMDW